ncbi:hypothetical protein [Bdellovibrio sp. NC01]|uniref:TraG/VirB4 family ATPase n=1 Tax=Bdellovibrio sp. NC01 TaxID=2220073 RepID=UPI00115A961F|nr:hypothetical protein [Bdellovibrio sp. NC01]QDK37916.1 hypothetical protein DOE51_10135 [Bdellovibrio sp. NC01]
MIPVFSHFENYLNFQIAVTTDGVVFIGFTTPFCDYEIDDARSFHQRLVQVLKPLDPSIIVRVELESKERNDLNEDIPRSKAINEIGFVQNEARIFISVHPPVFNLFRKKQGPQNLFELLTTTVESFKSLGFDLQPLSEAQTVQSFPGDLVIGERSLEGPTESTGVVRILKNPHAEFNFHDLNKALLKLPKPFKYVVSFQRLGEAKAKVLLDRKSKQLEGSHKVEERLQQASMEDAQSDAFTSGMQLFEIESLLVLSRDSQKELSKDLRTSQSALSLFCESMIETFGLLPSFAATLPGSRLHVPLLENEDALVQSLPLFAPREVEVLRSDRVLTLHRSDNTLFQFDLFNPLFNSFNALIVGPTGRGKSVLTGLLTTAVLNAPEVHVIKIDVGGSHSKECELLGGEEFVFELNTPSNLNPLKSLMMHNASLSERIAIASKFLSVLIQEIGEKDLTKEMRGEIESHVRSYFESVPQNPSISDFVEKSPTFPRVGLLKRWTNGGLYGSAFGNSAEGVVAPEADWGKSSVRATTLPYPSRRLKYYNFSKIFQAADPEFAVAGFAALMAEVNSQVLANDGRRLVLVLDEVPFFIKQCFDLIKFTAANFRKYGHAVIPISQLMDHLIVEGDMGLVENISQRFLFGATAHVEEQYQPILNGLQSIPGQYSEVALQTEEGMRKHVIKLSREEYWERTSSKTDKEKMRKMMEAVPGLTTQQAIKILSLE